MYGQASDKAQKALVDYKEDLGGESSVLLLPGYFVAAESQIHEQQLKKRQKIFQLLHIGITLDIINQKIKHQRKIINNKMILLMSTFIILIIQSKYCLWRTVAQNIFQITYGLDRLQQSNMGTIFQHKKLLSEAEYFYGKTSEIWYRFLNENTWKCMISKRNADQYHLYNQSKSLQGQQFLNNYLQKHPQKHMKKQYLRKRQSDIFIQIFLKLLMSRREGYQNFLLKSWREEYEEGLFFFIKEYIQQYKGKDPEPDQKQLAYWKWFRMSRFQRFKYQKEAIEEQQQNTFQQQEQEKEYLEVQYFIEVRIVEGLFFFIKEYVQLQKRKDPEPDLELQSQWKSQRKWFKMSKLSRFEYFKKLVEEQEQNNEQQKEQEKEQLKVQQQIEAPIEKRKNQRGKRNATASPQPKKERQKKKAQSVDNEEQVVQQKRGRPRKQNGEPQAKTIARTVKTKQLNDMQVQEQKDKEEQAQLKQHILAMANSKVCYQHRNHKEIIDTLLLHKKYDVELNIKYYENQIMEDKNQIKKNKK